MRFTRVLLITPPVKTGLGPVRPNIGLGYLAQMLLENNISYDVLDMLLGYSLGDLKKKIVKYKPDLLGVNIFSNGYKITFEIINSIKKSFPRIKVLAGGPHVSCLKDQVLKDCPGVDYGIILEGESALLELCRGEELNMIKNLIYREGSGIITNAARSFAKELDKFSFPTYQKFEIDRYINEKSLVSSRGCPCECIYCAVGAVSGKEIRFRSPENVAVEIEYWYRKGYKQFSFQDDNFAFHKENVCRICDEILSRKFKDACFRASGIRADKLDRDLLKKMKEAGFVSIALGVEVGNDKMLRFIQKGEKFEDIDQAVKLACEFGFDVQLYFLSGVPGETLADVQDSIAFALKYPILYAEWFPLIPYPGTKLYDWLVQKEYLLAKPEEYLNYSSTRLHSVTANTYTSIFRIPGLSVQDRQKNLLLLKKVRRKILKRGINRRLAQIGLPWGVRDFISYAISSDFVSKYLFQIKLRNIVDKIKSSFYVKLRQKEKNFGCGNN